MAAKKVQKCHCNSCGRRTDHVLVSKKVVEELEELDETSAYWWTDTYETLQCRGCSTVCLRHTFEDPSGEPEVNYYPPPISRRAPRWRYRLPADLRELQDEIYKALQNDSRSLATMGTRTLVDMFMLKEVGDTGSFAKKLDKLREGPDLGTGKRYSRGGSRRRKRCGAPWLQAGSC